MNCNCISYIFLLLVCVAFVRTEIYPESCEELGISISGAKQAKCTNKFANYYTACSTSSYTRDLYEHAVSEACCHTVCQKFANGKVSAVKCKREVGYYMADYRRKTTGQDLKDLESMICTHEEFDKRYNIKRN